MSLSKLVRWVQARSFAITPEQIGVAEGLRAATAVALMVALTILLNSPSLSWAAFAAFWTSLADPGGPTRSRLGAMGAFAAAGTVLAGLASAAAALGQPAAAAILFVLVFLCGLGRTFGVAGAQVGVLAAVVTVVAMGYPRPPVEALRLSEIFLMGSAWATLLCVAIWRIHPLMPARRAVSAIFADLKDMAAALTERSHASDSDTEHRRTVRMTIERARAMVRDSVAGRGDAVIRRNLTRAIDAGDRLLSALAALGHELREDRDRPNSGLAIGAIGQLCHALDLVRQQLSRIEPDNGLIAAEAKLVAGLAEGDDASFAAVFKVCGQALAEMAAPVPTSAEDGAEISGSRRRRLASPNPSIWRHACRVAVAVLAAYCIATYFALPYASWATMATVVVMQPQSSSTWPRTVERMIGSIIGGATAAFLASYLRSPIELLAAIYPLAAAAIAFRLVNYTLYVMFLTPLFVLVAEIITPGGGETIAWERALNNILGSLVGLAGCLFLWPEREGKELGTLLAEAIEANFKYAALVAGNAGTPAEEIDRARRAAGLASTCAEVARHRMILEGRRKRAHLDEAGHVLSALRMVVGAATAAWLRGDPSGSVDRASRYEEMASMLGKAARDMPAFNAAHVRWSEPLDGIDKTIVNSVESFLLYEKAFKRSVPQAAFRDLP